MSFYCARCASPYNRVKEARATADGSVRRRRQCEACDHKFTTVEVTKEELDRLRGIASAVRSFQHLLDLTDPLHPGANST